MQFQVPQYYDVQEKIVGPLTLRQFLYIAAACLISFFLFFVFNLWLWFFVSGSLVAVAVTLAFVKINGQSLSKILSAALYYYWRPKIYLWQKEIEKETIETKIKTKIETQQIKEIKKELGGQRKLKNLGQKILTSRSPLANERPHRLNIKEQFQIFRKLTGEKEIAKRVDYR